MSAPKRILFVDDEPNILAGLKRMLRSKRKDWDMIFAEGGAAALDVMAQAPVDVVVTDMRMPGMDGAELLHRVMKTHPGTIRIVLSGQADRDAILNAVGPIHQYLSKPCDADTLKDTLERACNLGSLLADTELKKHISQMETLPSLPSLYDQVLGELQSPDVSAASLGDLISLDMGMSAKVLQLVNSAFFGLRAHIPSPTQAVILLGLDTVKILGLSAKVFSQFQPAHLDQLSPLKTLWEHSVTVSTFARKIAQAHGADRKTTDFAYIGGLLHDVGKLVLAAHFSQQYGQVIEAVTRGKMGVLQAEREILGATHTEVGAYLMGLWGLPEPVVDVVYYHHQPQNYAIQAFSPVTAVYLANTFAYEAHPSEALRTEFEIDQAYLSQLGLAQNFPLWQQMCREALLQDVIL